MGLQKYKYAYGHHGKILLRRLCEYPYKRYAGHK